MRFKFTIIITFSLGFYIDFFLIDSFRGYTVIMPLFLFFYLYLISRRKNNNPVFIIIECMSLFALIGLSINSFWLYIDLKNNEFIGDMWGFGLLYVTFIGFIMGLFFGIFIQKKINS